MKYLFCLLSCLIANHVAFSQEWALKGTLGFPGGESFTYELHLQEEVNGTLRGYSLLYAQPGNETRATVSGHINREKNLLEISEQSIDYSRNFESRAYICRINASLSYHPYASAGRPGLFGITGANEYNDNRCNTGTLSFNATDALRKFFTKPANTAVVSNAETAMPESTPKNLPLPQPVPEAPAQPAATSVLKKLFAGKKTSPVAAQEPSAAANLPAPSAAQESAATDSAQAAAPGIENMPANQKPSPRRFYFPKKEKKITPEPPKPRDTTGGFHLMDGESATVTCKSEVLEVSIFVGSSKVDGDQVTLQYNDRPLLKNFTLRATAQPLRLPLGKGGKLRVLAIAEGTEKPCEAYLYINDGGQLHRYVFRLTAGSEASLLIQREGQS